MLDPYLANIEDAQIWRTLLQDSNGLCQFLQENNFAVLDSGFQHIKVKLELRKIEVLIPALKGKRKQLTSRVKRVSV